MFVSFFYTLKEAGIPISPTSFLRLHKALKLGLVTGLDDFYTTARSILVKSERYFDLYDRVFAHLFHGAELPDFTGIDLDSAAQDLLNEWLKDPEALAHPSGSVRRSYKSYHRKSCSNIFWTGLRNRPKPTTAEVGG